MTPDEEWLIQVVEFDTGNVVKTAGPWPERKAEKVERGMLINMDRDKFYTRLVPKNHVE